jgi:hypothetical protein
MIKAVTVVVFLSVAAVNGLAAPCSTAVGCHAVPEPSAIPEFLVCIGVVGVLAWRLRKQSSQKDLRP